MKPRIYTIENCPYCSELKDLLIKEGIEFTDVNVDLKENENEYIQISEVTKSEQVPIVKIGKQLLVPNVSFHTIKDAAELVKKFVSEANS